MEIYTFPAIRIYCRHGELLHLEFEGVDLDIHPLLVGVPAYYIVHTGASEGLVLCKMAYRTYTHGIYIRLKNFQIFFPVNHQGPCSDSEQWIRLNNLPILEGTL